MLLVVVHYICQALHGKDHLSRIPLAKLPFVKKSSFKVCYVLHTRLCYFKALEKCPETKSEEST